MVTPEKPGCSGCVTGNCSAAAAFTISLMRTMSRPSSGVKPQPELGGLGDHVEHAAVGHIDGGRAQVRHLDHRVQVRGERGHVAEGDLFDLAALARRADADQPGGRFERELGHRLDHRDHAGLQQHRRHADRVGARHAGVLDLLHDHEARVRLRPGRRQDHVAAERGIAARLAQHQLAQPVAVIAQVAHLVVHRRAGHVEHPADDHPARLAARVGVDGLDRFLRSRMVTSVLYRASTSICWIPVYHIRVVREKVTSCCLTAENVINFGGNETDLIPVIAKGQS